MKESDPLRHTLKDYYMTDVNPKTTDLKVRKLINQDKKESFILSQLNNNNFFIKSGVVRAPFQPRQTDHSAYLTLAHGPADDNEFVNYLGELDQFMETWTDKYNTKFGTQMTYTPLLKTPLKRDESGTLVANHEALEKYGYTTDVWIHKLNGRFQVSIDNTKQKSVSELDFEGLVNPSSRFVCVCHAGISRYDNKGVDEIKISLMLRRIKVLESAYELVDLEEPLNRSKPEIVDIDL